MPESDPLAILLAHNHWATQQLLDSCAQLPDEQFHQTFEMGLGSLHDTIVHIIGAMRGWGDLLGRREFRDRPEGTSYSIDELRTMLDEATADLSRSARDHPMDEILTRERGGREYSFTRGAVLTHVTTHGMHHRAQCLNMLRQVGVENLPQSSVAEWTLLGN